MRSERNPRPAAAGYGRHHEAALEWLHAQNPDVALLQEVELARVISWEGARVHCLPTSPSARTGNAVIARSRRLEPLTIQIDGALVAAARAQIVDADFLLVSAHVLTDDREHRGRQRRALGSFVTRLAELVADGRCIVAGDFNASVHWPEYKEWFFEPMRKAGFEDARPYAHEVRSYWGRGSTAIIQDDHVFVDAATKRAANGGSWAIISSEDHRRWSDHGPVVVDVGK